MRHGKSHRPPGRPTSNTECVGWQLPRATAALIRAECQRVGCNPGYCVARVVLIRYLGASETARTRDSSTAKAVLLNLPECCGTLFGKAH
jgi:hypothetical protein